MKIIVTLCLYFLSFSCFAATSVPLHTQTHSIVKSCEQAVPSTDAGFCPSFKAVAECHCLENGLGPDTCGDMGALYQYMLDFFGSLENACSFQQDSDYTTCMDDWNCYRKGGTNSQGGLCSATGSAC
jgi:hypothetical protein